MATEARMQANRLNAQKSTGPRTSEGKAKVSQNAVKHGLLAPTAVLPGEAGKQYASYHEEMVRELHPNGMEEMELAERVIHRSWRLGRAARYQEEIFEALYEKYAAEMAQAGVPAEEGGPPAGDPVLGRMLLDDFSGPCSMSAGSRAACAGPGPNCGNCSLRTAQATGR